MAASKNLTAVDLLVGHFTEVGYHSRSNKHSNFLASAIVSDLVARCSAIAADAREGKLVYKLNYGSRSGAGDQNIDLVIGPPAGDETPVSEGMGEGTPVRIRIAFELKNVMTEHGKARLNRVRDLRSHASYVHSLDRRAIAVGVMVLNAAPMFQSMLRKEPTTHKNLETLLPKFIMEIRQLPERQSEDAKADELEARCVILVDFYGEAGKPAKIITKAPAPQIGDNLHYEAMLRNVCDHYTNRFASRKG